MKQNYLNYLLVSILLAGFYTLSDFQQAGAQNLSPVIIESEIIPIEGLITKENQGASTSSLPLISPTKSDSRLPLDRAIVSSKSIQTPRGKFNIIATSQVTQSAILTSSISALPPAETNVLAVSLAELGYETEILNSFSGRKSFNIGLPAHWEILPGSSLALSLDYSGFEDTIIPSDPASDPDTGPSIVDLQVTLNDELVYQTSLTSFGQQSLTISLPDQWPERLENSDRLEIIVAERNLSCEEDSQGFVSILPETLLTLPYRAGPLTLDLARYPAPFYESIFFSKATHLILPEKPSIPQMESGLSLVAGLGNLTANNLVITTTTDSTWDPANPLREHLVLVGTPHTNNLISLLNDNTLLPAPLRQRRLKLTTSGPNPAAPGDPLTYTFQVTNTETAPITLQLRTWLPYSIKDLNCQPNCQLEETHVSWNINALAPDTTSTYTLSFNLPATVTLRSLDLTSELAQGQDVVNVSTLQSMVKPGNSSTLSHTRQIGDVFFVVNGRAIPETDGILQLLPSPWQQEKALLFVTGLTDEGVLKAGRALGATAHFPGMQGQVVMVQDIVQQTYKPPEPVQEFTLADLGYGDGVVRGVGQRNVWYRFNLPLSWRLTEDASIRLLFSHSHLLDPVQSSLNLFFNGTPIASIALDESNALASEMSVPLPPRSARPGQGNVLEVRVENRLPYPCADPDSAQAWVNLSASSSLSLPHVLNNKNEQFDLDFLPLPFTANPNLTDIIFALPEYPSDLEYNAAMKIASQLGESSEGDNFRPAVLLGEVADANLSDSHLIVIGRHSRNPVLQMVNDMLPQPFLPETDMIQQQIDEIIFRLPSNLDLGYLQLIPSSWNGQNVLLAVTGTSDLGLKAATQMLIDSSQSKMLKGNLALSNAEQLFAIDTRELTVGGELAAITTAIPETIVIGTATPTPTPQPTPLSIAQANNNPDSNVSLATAESQFPTWFPFMISGSILTILILLGIAYRQSRRRNQLGL